jgi:hypothetical protein
MQSGTRAAEEAGHSKLEAMSSVIVILQIGSSLQQCRVTGIRVRNILLTWQTCFVLGHDHEALLHSPSWLVLVVSDIVIG